jgi:hypothetical protein
MPERAKMRPDDTDGFREAWAILERLWKGTVAPQLRQRCVGGPDSARHRLAMAPAGLPWDEAPGWDGIPWDREARPSLDEVLTVRLAQMETFPVKECLCIELNEEWQHRLYSERDLDTLES